MQAKSRAARRRRKSLDAFITEEMRNTEFRIHFREARAKSDAVGMQLTINLVRAS